MNLRSRVSIFDTLSAQTTINDLQLRELVNFIALNRSYKMNSVDVRTMLNVKPLTVTPIGSLFERAVELHKETRFSFMRVPPMVSSTPEVVTYTHVTFDLRQIAALNDPRLSGVLNTLSDFKDTIFLNVTTLLRRSGELIDTTTFQSTIVRDLLSRSYYDNKTTAWLTPSLLGYLCRFYNMSMASSIAAIYNLTFQEQQIVATVFSLFFLQKVSDTDSAEIMVKTAKLNLGTPDQITGVINKMKDLLAERYAAMTLDDVCQVINSLGINRLQGINRKFLYTRQRNIGPDVLTSAMAIEYPPYWCYLVLATISGRKMGLLSTYKRNDLFRDAPVFVENLLRTQSFLPSV